MEKFKVKFRDTDMSPMELEARNYYDAVREFVRKNGLVPEYSMESLVRSTSASKVNRRKRGRKPKKDFRERLKERGYEF